MAIEFECEHCKRPLALKDKCAGLTGKCPYCKKVITVPTATSPPPEPPEPKKPDRKNPTEKQIDYARSLGIDIPEDISRHKLSELIDEAKDNLPATDKQKEFLQDLGISFPEDIRRNQISMLIDAALDLQGQMETRAPQRLEEQMREAGMIVDSASEEQLFEELSNRGKMFFAFVMDDDEFRYQKNLPVKGRLVWNDGLTIEDVKYILARLALDWARDLDMNAYAEEFDGNPPEVEFTASELASNGNVVEMRITPFMEE